MLEEPEAPRSQLQSGDYERIIKALKESMELTSYSSLAVLSVPGNKGVRWRMDFAAPDRFQVRQQTFGNPTSEFDRWITIGNQHYLYFGFWLKMDAGKMPDRARLNRMLQLHGILTSILNNVKAEAWARIGPPTRQLLLAEYESEPPEDLTR